jgi:G3E family GTPase
MALPNNENYSRPSSRDEEARMGVTVVVGPDAGAFADAITPPLADRGPLAVLSAAIDRDEVADPAVPHGCGVDSVLMAGLEQAGELEPTGRVLVIAPPDAPVVRVVASVLATTGRSAGPVLDGVICALDGPAASTRVSSGGPVIDDPVALAIADTVVVGRAARLTAEGWGRVTRAVRARNAHATLAAPTRQTTGLTDVIGGRGWSGPLAQRPSGPSRTHAVVLESPGEIDPARFLAWFEAIGGVHPGCIWRMQGRLTARGGRAVQVTGCGSVVVAAEAHRNGRCSSAVGNRVVLIGDRPRLENLGPAFARLAGG